MLPILKIQILTANRVDCHTVRQQTVTIVLTVVHSLAQSLQTQTRNWLLALICANTFQLTRVCKENVGLRDSMTEVGTTHYALV